MTEVWQETHIGSYMKLLSGFPFSSNAFSTSEGFPLIRIRDILDSSIETYYMGNFAPSYVVNEGDILVGMDGDFNVRKWRNSDALLNQRILKIGTLEPNKLDVGFLFFWLHPFLQRVNDVTAATTVKHLSIKDLQMAVAKLPSAKIQRRISAILQTIERTIEKTEALIEKYELIKAGMMQDLFTRGLTADGKLRPPRDQAPELYKKNPIGWIPTEWNTSYVGDAIDRVEQGWSPDCEADPADPAEWGVIKTTAVTWSGFDRDANKTLPTQLKPRLQYALKEGDLLITRAGPNSRVGVVALVKGDPGRLLLSDKLYRLVPKVGNEADFLSLALSSQITQRYLDGYKTGLAESQTNISQAIIRKLMIVDPPKSEKIEITATANSITDKVRNLQVHLTKLKDQKAGLMQDLLTGKVAVKVCEPEPAHV